VESLSALVEHHDGRLEIVHSAPPAIGIAPAPVAPQETVLHLP
jgi:hypothetical protein